MSSQAPESLVRFLEPAQRALTVLGTAVSLTDDVACLLIRECAPSEFEPDSIVRCLHNCDFVIERNSEWHLAPAARRSLQTRLRQEEGLARQAHNLLLRIASQSSGHIEVPSYLKSQVGLAYHTTAIDPDEGLRLYAGCYAPGLTGAAWLVGTLAEEQQEAGFLPATAIEPNYYRGLTAYLEGSWFEADRCLTLVAESQQVRIETAIAYHLLGVMNSKRRFKLKRAEDLLRSSLSIGEAIGDRYHQAQVKHTLGTVIQGRKPEEAEELLRSSLSLGEAIGQRHHQAQVKHSLGMFLQYRNPREAEALLRQSLSIEEEMGHLLHAAEVMHTLGKVIRSRKPQEAVGLLRASLVARRDLRDRHGTATVMHTLAIALGEIEPQGAEDLLRESLSILRELGDQHGQAEVMNTLGRMIWSSKPREAEDYLRRSLYILRRSGDRRGQGLVLLNLGTAMLSTKPKEAKEMLLESLRIFVEVGDLHRQRLVKRSLGTLGNASDQGDLGPFLGEDRR
jgi:tetratricopeptide (TPR) repeat protein